MAKRYLCSILTVGILTVAGVSMLEAPRVLAEPDATADKTAEVSTHDELILRSGKIIKGQIVEETASYIKIDAEFVGGITAVATYQKSEILEIKKDVEDAPKKEEIKASADTGSRPWERVVEQAETGDKTGAIFYMAELEGNFGWDVSQTPLADLFDDVDTVFDDIGPDGTVQSEFRDRHIVVLKMDCATNPAQGFDGFWRVEDIGPVVEHEIQKKKRRVIFWIDRAGGGAAFLPFVSPEIYFESEGRLGSYGDLAEFDIGDARVNEKQISLRVGHAEGILISGGYNPILVEAMVRSDEWLAARIVGGRPEYLSRKPEPDDGGGWVILTDNGEGDFEDHEDTLDEDRNDTLSLDSEWAYKLGVSDGTADTHEDLAFALGFQRNYVVLEPDETKSEDVLKGWRDAIDAAWKNINPNQGQNLGRLWKEYYETQVQGDEKDMTRALGRRMRLLKEIRSILTLYAEVFDPSGQFRAQIDDLIDQNRQALRSVRDGGRSGGGNSGGMG